MQIGNCKKQLEAQESKQKQFKEIASKRNLEYGYGYAYNILYRQAKTDYIVVNTLNNLASKYQVIFNFETHDNYFNVSLNGNLIFQGTFDEMETLMKRGIKSHFLKFWDELVVSNMILL